MRRLVAGALAVAVAAALVAPAAQAVEPRHTDRWLAVLEHARDARSPALVDGLLARAGARIAGPGAPSLGVITVRGPIEAIERLRQDPAVKGVSREWIRDLRRMPNDPALSTAEGQYQVAAGTPIQWALARQGFPAAWDVTTGATARVAVLDTGIDGNHPELSGKIASADAVDAADDPRSDSDGHGTHVAGLACANTDDGRGVAGAGWGCRLHVVKLGADLTGGIPDENVVRGLAIAIAHAPHAINMSFGGGPASAALDAAIQTAYDRGIVLVAAASNADEEDQGAPASQLQPGDAADIDAGRGLVVTAADFHDRRPATGRGPQISLAAYGFYDETEGPPGLISTYPGGMTLRDVPDCTPLILPTCGRRDFGGNDSYAYLQGTSMATPQVTALAALVGALNPQLSVRDKLRLIKETARRSGGWSPELGWGILDAGAAVDAARRIDRLAPASRVRVARRRGRRLRLVVHAADRGATSGLVPSGVTRIRLYGWRGHGPDRRLRRVKRGRATVVLPRAGRWRLYTRAVDAAGNVEPPPAKPDARVRIRG